VVDGKWKGGVVELDKATRAEMTRLSKEIAGAARSGLALPGTLNQRFSKCGKPTCRCKADPPVLHGPYWSWTRKIDNKTVTRYLSPEEVDRYEALFDNAKRLRHLVAELQALSLTVVEDDLAEEHAASQPA
jgi:hypothetical protein